MVAVGAFLGLLVLFGLEPFARWLVASVGGDRGGQVFEPGTVRTLAAWAFAAGAISQLFWALNTAADRRR